MKLKYLLLFLLSAIAYLNITAQQKILTSYEKRHIEIFKNFINYMTKCIQNKRDVTTIEELQYIASHFVVVNAKKDSSSGSFLTYLDSSQLATLRRSISAFYQFFQERIFHSADSVLALPLRLYGDARLYNRLSEFQKKNTLVFFDKSHMSTPIGYVLLLPSVSGITNIDMIWSWVLEYKFGKFIFVSATGQEGYEYLFSRGK